MSELVSIIIPVFNRAFVIREALESVLNQTYQNWEAVIVNDGSTDDTSEIVKACMRLDSRLNLIEHDRQRGAQAARNTALRIARGKWIAFLDSDDRWLPHSLEARLQLATKNNLHVVHSECWVLSPEGTGPQRFGLPRMEKQVYKELLRRPGPMFQGLLVSEEAFNHTGLLDESIVSYQEWDTAIRLAKHYVFGFVPEPTFLYDCRHVDTISKDLRRAAEGYEQVFTKHIWPILRFLGTNALAAHYRMAADLYFEARDENNAQRCLRRAFLFSPFRRREIFSRVRRLLRLGV
jgi:glycosyltransferase involved in cell wall biosynthesis